MKYILTVFAFFLSMFMFGQEEQLLDSTILLKWNEDHDSLAETSKVSYTYDAAGNRLSSISFKRETIIFHWWTWGLDRKNEYEYDGNGQLIQSNSFTYDPIASSWNNRDKETRSYYPNGIQKERCKYTWNFGWQGILKHVTIINDNELIESFLQYDWQNDIQNWVLMFKSETEYDLEGRRKQTVYSEKDTVLNEWNYYQKYEYYYDENGNEILVNRFVWNDDAEHWENSSKSERNYNPEGNMLNKTYSRWDVSNLIWKFVDKDEYDRNSLGQLKLHIEYEWSDEFNGWIQQKKTEYTYNSDDKISIYSSYYYDEDEAYWKPFKRFEVSYFENGLEKTHISFNWSPSINDWSATWKYDKSYNDSGNVLFSRSSSWDTESADWKVKEEKRYFYNNEVTLKLIKPVEDYLFVYPNPVGDVLNIKFPTDQEAIFELYDLQGRHIMGRKLSCSTTLNLEHIESGSYHYLLHTKGSRHKGKLVKL